MFRCSGLWLELPVRHSRPLARLQPSDIMSGDECEGWHPSDQFDGVFSQTQGRTWTGSVDRGYKKHHIGTHGSQEHAAKARDMCVRCIIAQQPGTLTCLSAHHLLKELHATWTGRAILQGALQAGGP